MPEANKSSGAAFDPSGESRSVVQWLVASSGAIGALLIAGLSLKDPAALTSARQDDARFWLIVAFGALAILLGLTAWGSLRTVFVSTSELAKGTERFGSRKWLWNSVSADEFAALGIGSNEDAKTIPDKLSEYQAAITSADDDAGLAIAVATHERARGARDELIHRLAARRRLIRTVLVVIVASVLMGFIALATFEYALIVYAPEPITEVEASISPELSEPISVDLRIEGLGTEEREALGLDSCDLTASRRSLLVRYRALAKDKLGADVLLLDADDCNGLESSYLVGVPIKALRIAQESDDDG